MSHTTLRFSSVSRPFDTHVQKLSVGTNHHSLVLLQSMTIRLTKFKDRSSSEEVPSVKYLLLWIVRLIHADPNLMLHVSIWILIFCSIKTLWTLLLLQNPGKAGHEIQSSTLELINGLVSLVHQQSMNDVAQEGMEVSL